MQYWKRWNLKKDLKKDLTDLVIFLAFFLGYDGSKTPKLNRNCTDLFLLTVKEYMLKLYSNFTITHTTGQTLPCIWGGSEGLDIVSLP